MADTRRQFLQFAAGALASVILPGCGKQTPPPPGQGESFPEVSLPDLQGRNTPLPKGPALVVNFWATWCSPCRREMPSLQQLGMRYRPQDLQVVGISVDDDLNLVKEFQLRYGIAFPLLWDREQRLSSTQMQIATLPMTYLLTRDRIIAGVIAGARDWADAAIIGEIDNALSLGRR